MSKKYKNKVCVYCAEAPSTSPDHVFAREFFLTTDRQNLPQVPACSACNGTKSQLEHHLTTVLPFGARHAAAKANLETMVPPRLAKNQKLHRELAAGSRPAWVKEDGLYVPTTSVPIKPTYVEELFSLIARGLVWFHWKVLLTREHAVGIVVLTDAGERYFDKHFFNVQVSGRVNADLGHSTVRYEGVQGVDNPAITAWRISLYGGMVFGDSQNPGPTASRIGVITGPKLPGMNTDSPLRFGVRLGA